MAYQALGLGSTANDGTGDDLRTGGDKINDNFVEIYTKLGDGSTLSSDTVALLTATQTMTNKTLTSPTISGTVTAATITTVTTGGIVGTGGALEVTPDNNILEIRGDGSSVEGQIKLNCHANSHGQTIKPQPHSANITNTMLLPAGASSTLVSLVSADTLTNKTLTTPTIASITNGGTVTIPSGADTLVARTSTDTLTNKTLTSPTITGTGAIAGVFTGNVTGNIDGIVGGTTPAAVTGTAISGTSIAVTGTAGAMKLNTVTTTQRNALSAAVGMIVYNSTTSKIQAYAGSAWVDLH
jgi:hypothetical protein